MEEDKLTNALTIPEYISKMDEEMKEIFAEMASKFPKGLKVPKYDKDCKGCPKPLEIFDEEK